MNKPEAPMNKPEATPTKTTPLCTAEQLRDMPAKQKLALTPNRAGKRMAERLRKQAARRTGQL